MKYLSFSLDFLVNNSVKKKKLRSVCASEIFASPFAQGSINFSDFLQQSHYADHELNPGASSLTSVKRNK